MRDVVSHLPLQLRYSVRFVFMFYRALCLAMFPSADTSTCLSRPSSGCRGPPLSGALHSPPSSVPWTRKTARRPSLTLPVSLGVQISLPSRFLRSPPGGPRILGEPGRLRLGVPDPFPGRRRRALLGSREVPLKACPGLGTPAISTRPRVSVESNAAFRLINGVGIATMSVFGAESSRATSSLCTLRTRQSPGEWQHSLPVRPLRL